MKTSDRPITAGELKHRIRIQSRSSADDGAGGNTITFVDLATVWARITTQNGREFEEQKKITPELTHMVRMRFRGDITPDMRVVWGSRMFNILAVYDPDGEQVELLIPAQEIVT